MPALVVDYAKPEPNRKVNLRTTLLIIPSTCLVTAVAAYFFYYDGPKATCGSGPSISSPLQVIRGQIELFKIQHGGHPPAQSAVADLLLHRSESQNTTHSDPKGDLGPYLPFLLPNPANNQTAIGNAPAKNVGWVYTVNDDDYTVQAVNTDGTAVLTY